MKAFLKNTLENIHNHMQSMRMLLQTIQTKQDKNLVDDTATELDQSSESSRLRSFSSYSATDYWGFWIIGVIVTAIGWFMFTIFDWLLLVFTGIIISIAIESLIGYFENKIHRRWLAIALAYFILIGLLLSGVLVMIPFLVNQLGDIISVIINWASVLEVNLKTIGLGEIVQHTWLYVYLKNFGIDLVEPRYLEQLQSIIQNNISAIIAFSSTYAKGAGSVVVNTVGSILSTLAQIGFVVTLSVLLSIEKTGFMKFINKVSGNSHAARRKITTLYTKLGFWLRTQVLLGVYIGIAMWIGLLILSVFGINIPNKGSLAVISALTELIPYLGPLLGGIPVVIMAAVSNGRIGVLIGGVLVFSVQWLENNILIPLLFKQNLGVSPVVVFLCMVLLGLTIGLNGVVIAIPIAVIITILFDKNE